MTQPNYFASQATPSANRVRYHRLDYEFTGTFNDNKPELKPIFVEGYAVIVPPEPGHCVRGILVDCPETDTLIGCVVVDTGVETVALCSPVLRELVIENSPCHLEFESVSLQSHSGQKWWDWAAFEISPNGGRIPVSESHSEYHEALGHNWAKELGQTILPALEEELRCLGNRESTIRSQFVAEFPSLESPLDAVLLEYVKEQFFGLPYQAAKQALDPADLELFGVARSRFPSNLDYEAALREGSPRALVAYFENSCAHPSIARKLQERVNRMRARHAQLLRLLRDITTSRTQAEHRIKEGRNLTSRLARLVERPVRMRHSTLAASRHRSLPDELTVL